MSESWSLSKCKSWLSFEVESGKTTLKEFQNRLIDWHVKEYEKAGNPSVLPWADKCLKTMHEAIKEMGIKEPKKSLFSKFKEDVK